MRVARGLLPIALAFGLVSGCGGDRRPVEGDAQRLITIEATPAQGRVGEPVRLVVTVTDADGVRRAGVRVSIESSRSTDVFSAQDGVTDDSGEIETSMIASAAGWRVIAAHVGAAEGMIALAIERERSDDRSACTDGLLLGGYSPLEPLPEKAGTSLMAAEDFDGDGGCDAAFVSDEWSADGSARLTTHGASSWPVVRDLMGAGWLPLAVATGDFDGDGRMDLAVAAADNGWTAFRVGWFSADGDRAWRRIAEVDLPFDVSALVSADIDGDGRSDLFAQSRFGLALRAVLLTDDGPVFGDEVSLQFGGERIVAWAIGDFDGDDKADLAIATHGGISILGGNGDGTFAPRQTLDLEADHAFPELVAADLDGDGLDDLVRPEFDSGQTFLTIFRGRTDGSFERVRVATQANGRLRTGDVDGDGVLDLVVRPGLWDGAELLVVRGDREGRFKGPERLLELPFPPLDMSICRGESGRPEIVVLGWTAWARIPLEAPAQGIVSSPFAWSGGLVGDPTEDGSVQIVTVDPDGGGRRIAIDAAGSTKTVQEFEIDLQLSRSVVHAVGRVGVEPLGSVVEVGREDLENGIVVHSLSGGTARQVATSADWIHAVTIVDVNGDGLNDIVFGTNTETIAVFADRAGDFHVERIADFGAWAIAAGDIDGDGRVQLILAGWGDVVAVSFGASFGPPEPLPLRPTEMSQHFFVGDFDGDGLDDIAVGGTAGTLTLYLHAPDGRFGPPLDFGVGGAIHAGAYGRLAGGSEWGFVLLADGPVARVVPVTCAEP